MAVTSRAQCTPAAVRVRRDADGRRGSRKAATAAANRDRTSPASDAGRRLPCSVWRTSVPLNSWPSPSPALYGPCSSSPSRVEASSPSELAVTSRLTSRRLPPSGQQKKGTPPAPPSSGEQGYPSQRTTANRSRPRAREGAKGGGADVGGAVGDVA